MPCSWRSCTPFAKSGRTWKILPTENRKESKKKGRIFVVCNVSCRLPYRWPYLVNPPGSSSEGVFFSHYEIRKFKKIQNSCAWWVGGVWEIEGGGGVP